MKMTGIILSGGRSTRLGGLNKAFIEVQGERLIERTLRIYGDLFAEVLIKSRWRGRESNP